MTRKIGVLVGMALWAGAWVASVEAQLSTVRIQVQELGDKSYQYRGNRGRRTTAAINTTKALEITLTSFAKDKVDAAVVKYYFFARDVDGGQIDMVESGELKAALEPMQKTVVKTKTVTMVYRMSYGRHPASGTKFEGYAVQVLNGEKLTGELYEPRTVKEELRKLGVPVGGAAEMGRPPTPASVPSAAPVPTPATPQH